MDSGESSAVTVTSVEFVRGQGIRSARFDKSEAGYLTCGMTRFPKSFRFSTLASALAFCALASPAVSVASDLASGSAKGSLTFDDTTAALAYAAAFVDQKDERKPVILLLSDKKLPTEKWTSDFDIMRDAMGSPDSLPVFLSS